MGKERTCREVSFGAIEIVAVLCIVLCGFVIGVLIARWTDCDGDNEWDGR